jgi:hypothetical protein
MYLHPQRRAKNANNNGITRRFANSWHDVGSMDQRANYTGRASKQV